MLIDEISSLPSSPGIYQYFDKDGKLLYVGKAKSLKNRVRSYFSFTPKLCANPRVGQRIAKMISQTTHLEYIITSNQSDALILENSFIKQLKPKYNILLRDDKTYPYICIDLSDEFARFEITRKVVKGKNVRYFGPYYRGARELLGAIYLQFALVQKKSCIKSKKSCLFYQIKRCKAPCENKISPSQYSQIVQGALKAIKNPEILIPNLSNLMMSYASSQNYEEAAKIRDTITTLKEIGVKIELDLAKLEDFEAMGVAVEDGFACLVRFSIRDGKVAGSNSTITSAKSFDSECIGEIYKHMILEAFPKQSPIASAKIYVNDKFDDQELVEEILSLRHGRKFRIITPKIGEKKNICELVVKNANLNIQKHIKTNNYELLEEIKSYFGLINLPVMIEAFDNSHLFSSSPVGSMVAFSLGKWQKDRYRHSHLKATNDYDQMMEFLSARAKRFEKLSPPDLWVIDGGQALRNLAEDIIISSGANVDIIAISKEKIDAKANRAKGRARDKIYTKGGVFEFAPESKILQFFQLLRDEAHRFAITFHQKTRQKFDMQSSKLKKVGLSDGNIKKLIDYYGSFEAIYEADIDEISQISGKTVAQKINLLNNC